jgi:hypothetical protein
MFCFRLLMIMYIDYIYVYMYEFWSWFKNEEGWEIVLKKTS